MFRMSRAVRGSISILLVLILLPMVTYSTMIIDATRLQTVRTNIQGAGDLTLNAALSEYDVMLEQMYGLFGNITDEADMQDAIESYFYQTLVGELKQANISVAEDSQAVEHAAQNLAKLVANKRGDITEDDIVSFVGTTIDDFSCEAVAGGALANPAIMKQQVVEYMKYKAPLSLASGLYDKIQSISNAAAQIDAINSKIDYEEKLSELTKYCRKAYHYIDDVYNPSVISFINPLIETAKDGTVKKGLNEAMEDVKEYYKKATVFYIMDENAPFKYKDLNYSSIYDELKSEYNFRSFNYNDYLVTGDSEDARLISARGQLNELKSEWIKYYNILSDNFFDVGESWYSISPSNIGKFEIPEENFPNKVAFYTHYQDNWHGVFAPHFYDGWNTSISDSKNYHEEYPNKSNIYDGKWKSGFGSAPNARIDGYEKTRDYCINYINELKKYDVGGERRNKIKEFIKIYEEMKSVRDRYDNIYWDYYSLIGKSFMEVHDGELIVNDSTKINAEDERKRINELWHGHLSYHQFDELTGFQLKYRSVNTQLDNFKKEIENHLNSINNEKVVFNKYGDYFRDEGFKTINGIYEILTVMKQELEKAKENLDKVVEILEKLGIPDKDGNYPEGTIANSWNAAISRIDSESTKASMQNDFDMTVCQFDPESAIALRKVVDDIGSKSGNELSELIDSIKKIKYLDRSIVNNTVSADYAKSDVNDGVRGKLIGWISNTDVNTAFVEPKMDEVMNMISRKFSWPNEALNAAAVSDNDKLKKSNTSINNASEAEGKANNLASTFVYSGFTDAMKKLRIIDGITDAEDKEDKIKPVYLVPQGESTVVGNHIKLAENSSENLIDDNEKFVWTLYSIAMSAKDAESSGSSDDATDSESGLSLKELKDFVSQNDAKSDKDDDESSEEKKKKLEETKNSFDAIMKTINDYVAVDDPSVSTNSISTPDLKTGKDASESSSNMDKNLGNKISGIVNNALNGIAQAGMMEEYFTEMFTCRTDKLDTADVVLLNGYGNERSKLSKQIPYQNTDEYPWYGYEIEYILWGQSNLSANYIYTDAMIFVIRFGLNLIYAFTAQDIAGFARTIATAVCVGPAVPAIPLVSSIIKILLAMAESGIDIVKLHQGLDVAIFKDARTFVCSPKGIKNLLNSSGVKDWAKQQAAAAIKDGEETLENFINKQIDAINTEIQGQANKKISEYTTQLNDCVDKFIDEQTESVKNAVKDILVTPVVNILNTLNGNIAAISKYQDDVVINKLINDTIDDAFTKLTENISKMDSGVISDILKEVVALDEFNNMKDALKSELCTYYNDNKTTFKMFDVNAFQKSMNEKIDAILDTADMKKFIKNQLDTISGKMKENIKKLGEEAAGNAKTIIHEQLNAASKEISGATDALIDSINIPEEKKDGLNLSKKEDKHESKLSCFTLNYKEYVKIFVLVNLAVPSHQDKMFQRAAVLVEKNVNVAKGSSDFQMINAQTMFSSRATVRMKTLFPWCVESTADGVYGDNSLIFDFSNLGKNEMKVGYCGFNGY